MAPDLKSTMKYFSNRAQLWTSRHLELARTAQLHNSSTPASFTVTRGIYTELGWVNWSTSRCSQTIQLQDYSDSALFTTGPHSSWFTVIGTRKMCGRDERNMVESGSRCPALKPNPRWLRGNVFLCVVISSLWQMLANTRALLFVMAIRHRSKKTVQQWRKRK